MVNVTGRFGFIAIVVIKTSAEFAEFMDEEISTIPNVMRTETSVRLPVFMVKVVATDMKHLVNSLDIPEFEGC